MNTNHTYQAEVDGVVAPHDVKDWAKVRSIIRAARRGEDVAGWVEVESSSGYEALSGSHRMAAVSLSKTLGQPIDITPRIVEMTEYIQESLENDDYYALQDDYNE